jgi:hypothetical protein
MFIPFPEFRPDVDDFRGQHTQVLSGVIPRGDGYGPMPNLQAFTAALPAACRGFFHARKSDGTIVVFAATANRIFRLDNTALTWVPVSKVTALTSISNATPAVFTKTSHGLVAGDAIVLSTSGGLPTGLTVGTVYYVISAGLTADAFEVSASVGGAAINTSSAGSGTHSYTNFYSDVSSTDQWQFAQFGSNVIAVQANSSPQVYDLASSAAFADLGGSPPTARYVTVVGRFLVLNGLVSNPTRVFWSDLDGITTWTAGTGFSNYVDLPDGGVVRGVAGGEFGLVFQESVIRRMVFVPGAKPAFQLERVTEDMGLLGPYSIARASEKVFFVSQHGFHEYSPGAGLQNIGKERVDRTFLASVDVGGLQYLFGTSDPSNTRVYWAYRSSGSSGAFDKILIYDYELKRWSPPLSINGEYLSTLVRPGVTLENVDTLFGSNIDTLSLASLDAIQAALTSKVAAMDLTHKLGFFDGANLEAVLETPEQSLDGRRVRVRGLEPRTDAPTVYGSVRFRDSAQALLSQTTETLVNTQGICPQNIDTKLARARARIPAAETWTSIMGVEADFVQAGKR